VSRRVVDLCLLLGRCDPRPDGICRGCGCAVAADSDVCRSEIAGTKPVPDPAPEESA
jgi:hypothetical protein